MVRATESGQGESVGTPSDVAQPPPPRQERGTAGGALAQIGAFVRLGRPVFLGGGVVMTALGAAVARPGALASGGLDWAAHLRAQAVVTCIQMMTHYANDYFDLDADRANATPTRWSGGSRVLPSGALPAWVALAAALLFAALAVALVGAFVFDGTFAHASRPLAVPLAAAMLALAWSYSAPPLRLHSTGLGALVVAFVVSGLVPALGFHMQASHVPTAALVPSLLGPFLLQAAMIVAIDVPDADGDAASGKRTLVVRFGLPVAAKVYAALTVAAFAIPPALAAAGLLPWRAPIALAPLTTVAAWQVVRVARGAFAVPTRHESLAFVAVALFALSGAATLAAFAWP